MSTGLQNGYAMEDKIRRMFHAEKSVCEWYDLETVTSLYEVKSCHLFVRVLDGRRKGFSTQLGRFWINAQNHQRLLEDSLSFKKVAKYVFVVHVDCRIQFLKVLDAEKLVVKTPNSHGLFRVCIREVFK
jgi:hypothetical protein